MIILVLLILGIVFLRVDPYLDISNDGVILWYSTLIKHNRKFIKLK
jgi:hypothetical protein